MDDVDVFEWVEFDFKVGVCVCVVGFVFVVVEWVVFVVVV